MNKKTEKKKLTPITAVRIAFVAFAIICAILGVVFGSINEPISGSIYTINSSRSKREEIWTEKYKELYNEYYAQTETPTIESINKYYNGLILYKYEYKTSTLPESKVLVIEFCNISESEVFIEGFIIQDKFNNIITAQTFAKTEIKAQEPTTFEVGVDIDFDISNTFVSLAKVYKDGVMYKTLMQVDEYYTKLETVKNHQINEKIEQKIGPKPTKEYEETNPDYMKVMERSKIRYILCFIGALIFGVVAGLMPTPAKNNETTPIKIQEELTQISEEETEIKVKQTTCSYCQNMYDRNLNSCPYCGASQKIKK